MHQQLWGYKVEWKSVSRGTGGKKVEYDWSRGSLLDRKLCRFPGCDIMTFRLFLKFLMLRYVKSSSYVTALKHLPD
jgi:hypothetical protein